MSKQTPAARRWAEIIDRQEASCQSIRAFAEANGLNHGSISYWRCQLGRTKKRPLTSTTTFVEVSVVEPPEPSVVLAFDDRVDRHPRGRRVEVAGVRRLGDHSGPVQDDFTHCRLPLATD